MDPKNLWILKTYGSYGSGTEKHKKGEVTSVKEKKRPRPPAALKAAWVLSWIRCMHGGQFCNIQIPIKGTVA